ncbi:MAG TPA: hypothetical protein VMA34_08365 [Terracidiphilus sp.]|nr:hypothetical protein [Terracidiphilus sp.]
MSQRGMVQVASYCDWALWSVMAMKSRPRRAEASTVKKTGQGTIVPVWLGHWPSLWALCMCRSPRNQAGPGRSGSRRTAG